MMAATTSFSKGCFVFKATPQDAVCRSPRKKARKTSESTCGDVSASLLFSKVDKPSTDARLEAYKKIWSKLEAKSEEIISESHEQLLDDIKNFVNNNVDATQNSIPTALVALGVNLPDHLAFFNLLDSTVKKHCSSFVAMLSSKECPSLKHMVQKAVQKLTMHESVDDEDVTIDEESEEEIKKMSSKPLGKQNKTFAHLAAWYSGVVLKTPLIIIIQDLEAFSTQQLQDFVLLCREYRLRNKLPLQFIMGIATTAAIQQQLHHRTSVCLATKSFQSLPSVVLLNHLIEKLFMRDSVMRLGPRLMQLLLDGFLYHDLSLNSFLLRIHLIVMQHYISLPMATLCCPVSQISTRVKQLSAADLDLYRQLPSFMHMIENDRSKSKLSLLTDDKQFRQYLITSLQALHEYSNNFSLHCRLLHSFSEGLPDALFGKTLREVYVNMLADGGKEDWKQFTRLLSLCSAHELRSRIEATLTTLRASDQTGASTSTSSSLILFLEQLRRLEETGGTSKSPNAKEPSVFVAQGNKKLDKFELKAQLLATAKQTKPTSAFDEIRAEIIAWLDSEFVANLKPPCTQIFHEITYAGSQVPSNWDIVPWIRRQIQPVPRVAISKALSNPAAYMGCTCCSTDGQESGLLPSMPDLCLVYKLHMECGRLINLYDWMVSFNCVHRKDEEEEGEEIEPIIQARFIRAVAQLQLLGFIQSSKRKTDHVSRLTWGV